MCEARSPCASLESMCGKDSMCRKKSMCEIALIESICCKEMVWRIRCIAGPLSPHLANHRARFVLFQIKI